MTLERRVGALYLAHLLTGDTAPELGDGREVRSVAFQQAPFISVDDVVVEAARPDETDTSVELAVGIRRSPNLARSDENSQKLVREYKTALPSVGVADPEDGTVRQRAWELLSCLWVLMPAVEDPDTSDWAAAQSRLVTVAEGSNLVGAGHLLDRLETLAAQYAPSAATIDRSLLRRDVHALLDDSRRRNQRGWELLEHLQGQARTTVRDRIGAGEAGDSIHLDRGTDGNSFMAAAEAAEALIVGGESGVGKSSLVLGAATAAAAASDGDMEVVCLNLRHLPESSFQLQTSLGCSMETLLADMSAPRRFLVLDGADAAAEPWREVFIYLVEAARTSGVRLIAVTSTDARPVVRDLVVSRYSADVVVDHTVGGLSDRQLDEVSASFPRLARLAANPRSRELLRRLVVVDLLVRSEVSGLPLSDADAMGQIWAGLVRNQGRRDRGLPDAREQVLLQLASRELAQGSVRELSGSLDASAVDGLRQDGLVRTSAENPWQIVPDFAHDEIRRYAVARVLLADDTPGETLLYFGAPRWALAAGRLACQAVLGRPDSASTPVRGRVARLQEAFDQLVEAGHGSRWADVPAEALLTVGDPGSILEDAWSWPRDGDGAGLRRLLRLIDQRHRDANRIVDAVVAEPVIALLLDDRAPWHQSKEAAEALREWLLALVARDAPAGHPLRVRLRGLLVARCDEAERQLRAREEAAAAARAARDPDEIERERKRLVRESERISAIIGRGRRRRERPRLARELTDDTVLELLALLGCANPARPPRPDPARWMREPRHARTRGWSPRATSRACWLVARPLPRRTARLAPRVPTSRQRVGRPRSKLRGAGRTGAAALVTSRGDDLAHRPR